MEIYSSYLDLHPNDQKHDFSAPVITLIQFAPAGVVKTETLFLPFYIRSIIFAGGRNQKPKYEAEKYFDMKVV
jgi:hypothetical protein